VVLGWWAVSYERGAPVALPQLIGAPHELHSDQGFVQTLQYNQHLNVPDVEPRFT